MSIKKLICERSAIIIIILIAQIILPVSKQNIKESQTLWGGLWVENQGVGNLVCERKRVKKKESGWYVKLRERVNVWRRGLQDKKVEHYLVYLLVLWALGWVLLLRLVVTRVMGADVLEGEGNWSWTERLPNEKSVLEVGLKVRVGEVKWGERREAVSELVLESEREEVRSEIKREESKTLQQMTTEEVELGKRPDKEIENELWVVEPDIGMDVEKDEESQAYETKEREQTPLSLIKEHFCGLKDPRVDRTKRHDLFDIVTITICAVVGGADNWVEVAEFGRAKEAWLKSFLELPNGIPSHDTFGRVFRLLNPQQWQDGFLSWVEAITETTKGQIVPIDGKALRRSHDKKLGAKAIHMVSAWASDSKVVLGQVKVDEKSNEITAIPTLLDMLTLSGSIVTIDAMGCQKNIARNIIDKNADYVLALKKNQNGLYEGVQALFDKASLDDFDSYHYHKTVEKSHGRQEIRHCRTISDPSLLARLYNFSQWKGLRSVVCVKAEQKRGDKATIEERFFISSLSVDSKQMLQVVRGHWAIENSLHWVLDIAFREDESRIRKGYGAQNFAVLRHLALNLLAQDDTLNCGTNTKRKKAGWDENLLLDILLNST